MTDDLEAILRRVAAGELSPDEAEPLVAAASGDRGTTADRPAPRTEGPDEGPSATGMSPARVVRVRVSDEGRQVVDLRIPMSLAGLAGSIIPGLAEGQVERIRQALRNGESGTILDVRDEDGSGVVIATE